MNVNDVVGILLDVYIGWARTLKPDEIDQWIQPDLQRYRSDYERLVLSNARRFIMIIVLDGYLAQAEHAPSPRRAELTGWRNVDEDDVERLVQRIYSWLAPLTMGKAFDAMLELILRWADQYNRQMAVEWAKFGGRMDADQYTNENITAFPRFCFHMDLELADAEITWHRWAD